MPAFAPRFIFETELSAYGLPDSTDQSNILSLVDAASTLIDEYCGRGDGDGNGSLCFTTYRQRIHLPEGRNVFRVAFRPLVGIPETVQVALAASGAQFGPWFYTGFTANTRTKSDGTTLSPLLSVSGRYGYSRRSQQAIGVDLGYGANILQVAAHFGGPPVFTNVDIGQVDVDERIGEVWIPAGLWLSQYTEVFVTYNSGFDPRSLPPAIKQATAALVRNFLSRGGGTTGLRGISAGRVSAQFTEELIDPTVDTWLQKFKTVVAY